MPPRIIDLSVPCSNRTEGVSIRQQPDVPVYLGHRCDAYDIVVKSHTGTYFETASHLFRGARSTADVPLDELVLPGVCLRVRTTGRCIHARDLEASCGDALDGVALLVHPVDRSDAYFSRDAAQWMAEQGVKLMGSSTPLYDRGFDDPTGFFVDLFKADIPIIANLRNVDQLPKRGFTLLTMPLNMVGVCTVPCRVAAATPPFPVS